MVSDLAAPHTEPGSGRRNRRVLFVIDQLSKPLGGAERILLKIVAHLPGHGFDCSIVTFDSNLTLADMESVACPLHVIGKTSGYGLDAIGTLIRLARFIRAKDVQIVHTFFESSDLWAGVLTRLMSPAMLVSSRRDMGILRSGKHQIAYRVLGPLAHKVLAVSDQVRQQVIAGDHLAPDKVLTVYNGLEAPAPRASAADELRERLGLPSTGCIVTSVGNVRRVKGFDVLAQAAAKVFARFPEAIFVVAGGVSEQEHFDRLLQLVESLGLAGKFKFIGHSSDVFPLLYASNVFVLPSRSEGFSNALLEAMAAGLPCIATRVGGNAEAIQEGQTGFLVAPENPDAIAERVTSLLQNPQQAKKMGDAARKRVQEIFSLEVMMEKIAAVYEELLASRPIRG